MANRVAVNLAHVLFFGLSVLLLFSVSGCEKKTTVQNADGSGPKEEASTQEPTAASQEPLAESELNVYVNGVKVNYLSDSIDSVRAILGKDQQDKEFGPGEGGKVYNELDAEGVKFIYDSKDGRFSTIVIKSDKYPVEGGGKVGDTREEVLSKYPKGFYQTMNGEEKRECYSYLRMNPNGEIGLGFDFCFDQNDRLQTIILGWKAFAP